jgi:hypothetical protein
MTVLVLAGLGVPTAGQAQTPGALLPVVDATPTPPIASPRERLSPWAGAAELFPPASAQAAEVSFAPPVLQARSRDRRGVPLMVAGGILFVAGAITGDDVGTILMLGGAGIGAWGAYIYFGG